MHFNAVTIRGLFSRRPLDQQTYDFMRSMPEPGMVVNEFHGANEREVAEWTNQIGKEVEAFRAALRKHLAARRAEATPKQLDSINVYLGLLEELIS